MSHECYDEIAARNPLLQKGAPTLDVLLRDAFDEAFGGAKPGTALFTRRRVILQVLAAACEADADGLTPATLWKLVGQEDDDEEEEEECGGLGWLERVVRLDDEGRLSFHRDVVAWFADTRRCGSHGGRPMLAEGHSRIRDALLLLPQAAEGTGATPAPKARSPGP